MNGSPSTRVGALLLTACLALTACGGQAGAGTGSLSSTSSAPVTPVLAASPVVGLTATTIDVTQQTLRDETTVAGVTQALDSSGFVGGRQRTFQGPSKDLTLVLSRSLAFRDAAGAEHFLSFVHDHADALFGLTTEVSPLAVGARSGWTFVAPQCACPGAQPRVVAVVQDGARIDWLTINGPQATTARARSLLAAPTTTR
jgi:hypothetical protein